MTIFKKSSFDEKNYYDMVNYKQKDDEDKRDTVNELFNIVNDNLSSEKTEFFGENSIKIKGRKIFKENTENFKNVYILSEKLSGLKDKKKLEQSVCAKAIKKEEIIFFRTKEEKSEKKQIENSFKLKYDKNDKLLENTDISTKYQIFEDWNLFDCGKNNCINFNLKEKKIISNNSEILDEFLPCDNPTINVLEERDFYFKKQDYSIEDYKNNQLEKSNKIKKFENFKEYQKQNIINLENFHLKNQLDKNNKRFYNDFPDLHNKNLSSEKQRIDNIYKLKKVNSFTEEKFKSDYKNLEFFHENSFSNADDDTIDFEVDLKEESEKHNSKILEKKLYQLDEKFENKNLDRQNLKDSCCIICDNNLLSFLDQIDTYGNQKICLNTNYQVLNDSIVNKNNINSFLNQPNNEYKLEPEENKKIFTLPCRHSFHKLCFIKWYNIKKVCPLCRLNLNSEHEFPIKNNLLNYFDIDENMNNIENINFNFKHNRELSASKKN